MNLQGPRLFIGLTNGHGDDMMSISTSIKTLVIAASAATVLALSPGAFAQTTDKAPGEGGRAGPGPLEQRGNNPALQSGSSSGSADTTGSVSSGATSGSMTERCRQIMANRSAYSAADLRACGVQ
jgi:hypothetical protein